MGMRRASNDRACVAVVFTGAGDKAFCTGGNTKEYAEYYAGQPEEYRQYMRLFNDMVTAILHCDKPVICRVNGMRIAGGQEIGMACDFTVAQDLALFGQAGPMHGSAPDGGSTDFLPLFIGIEAAMESCTLCEHWTAHKAYRMGLLTKVVPALKVDGEFVPNPMAITDRWVDEMGQIVYGEPGRRRREGQGQGASEERRGGPLPPGQGRGFPHQLHGHDHARMPLQDHRERAKAQAGPVGQEQGDQPGLVGAEHDDGGPGRVPGLQRRLQGVPGGGLHPSPATDGPGSQVGRRTHGRDPGQGPREGASRRLKRGETEGFLQGPDLG